ncbi:hypothetical protein [Haloterrigena turkmenica]|uniref:hypothetical protein n=1 Tax=Haloterrigena turkmenica TaxID=62320 RepID=UPI000677DB0B
MIVAHSEPFWSHTVVNWTRKVVVSVARLDELIGSTILAVVLLAEVPDAVTIAGGTVVLAGIYLTIVGRNSRGATDRAERRPRKRYSESVVRYFRPSSVIV